MPEEDGGRCIPEEVKGDRGMLRSRKPPRPPEALEVTATGERAHSATSSSPTAGGKAGAMAAQPPLSRTPSDETGGWDSNMQRE